MMASQSSPRAVKRPSKFKDSPHTHAHGAQLTEGRPRRPAACKHLNRDLTLAEAWDALRPTELGAGRHLNGGYPTFNWGQASPSTQTRSHTHVAFKIPAHLQEGFNEI